MRTQIPMAIVALFQKRLNEDMFHGSTDYTKVTALISSGYFLVDTSIVLKHFGEHGPEPLIHAVICVTFFTYSAIKKHLQWFVPRLLLWELSTPFVHLRWLLHALGKSKTKFYKVNGLLMMAVFFGTRIFFGTSAAHRCFARLPASLDCRGSLPLAQQLCVCKRLDSGSVSLRCFALRA